MAAVEKEIAAPATTAEALPESADFVPANKEKEEFRQHTDATNPRFDIVKETYRLMHEQQTVAYVRNMHEYWGRFDKAKMTIMEAIERLNELVDDSDPDTSMPNSVHAFQTAERLRQLHPDKDWLHLTGLIHDAGKVMALYGQPQWSTVGDTYPVGCAFSDKIVFAESFAENPDNSDKRYNSENGMYEPHCGLDNLLMSWGHDEYMYRVLLHNKCTIPQPGLDMIRYHSFYPWHSEGAYTHLLNDKTDVTKKAWVDEFNKFDLYSKSDTVPDAEALTPYYQGLIDKYCPGKLEW